MLFVCMQKAVVTVFGPSSYHPTRSVIGELSQAPRGGGEPTPVNNGKITYQLQLNGAYLPQFAATAEEMYSLSKNSILGSYNESTMSLQQYKNNYFVMCARLNMPESEFSRTLSGLDTRSVSLNGYFNTFNTNGSSNIVIFCECSSTLRVGQGRMLEVIS